MTTIAPVRREVLVRADLDTAFGLFTDQIGAWWPLETFSAHGAQATLAFEDGRLVERLGTASDVWAEVLEWDPPHLLRMTWHPARPEGPATEVTVRFAAEDEQVRVALEHVGWERLADPHEARTSYHDGWPMVLGRYADAVSAGTARPRASVAGRSADRTPASGS